MMTIGELKKMIAELPDDMEVIYYSGRGEQYTSVFSVQTVDMIKKPISCGLHYYSPREYVVRELSDSDILIQALVFSV